MLNHINYMCSDTVCVELYCRINTQISNKKKPQKCSSPIEMHLYYME